MVFWVLTSQGDLTAKEYENILLRCANAINSRPLGLRHHGGANPEYHVITPNLLLDDVRKPRIISGTNKKEIWCDDMVFWVGASMVSEAKWSGVDSIGTPQQHILILLGSEISFLL